MSSVVHREFQLTETEVVEIGQKKKIGRGCTFTVQSEKLG